MMSLVNWILLTFLFIAVTAWALVRVASAFDDASESSAPGEPGLDSPEDTANTRHP